MKNWRSILSWRTEETPQELRIGARIQLNDDGLMLEYLLNMPPDYAGNRGTITQIDNTPVGDVCIKIDADIPGQDWWIGLRDWKKLFKVIPNDQDWLNGL